MHLKKCLIKVFCLSPWNDGKCLAYGDVPILCSALIKRLGSGNRLGFKLTLNCRRHFFSRITTYHCNLTASFQLDNLALCGDVHPNPGHGNTSEKAGAFAGSIPRGDTHYKPVRLNQKGILCDGCCNWHHAKCIGLESREYMMLSSSDDSWYCANCFFPFNFTDSTDRLTEHATGSDLQASLSSERVITDVHN